ncbi:hypothetical protein BD626DRAFT_484109 [Schizophyllum amplum]|uniref:Uncharacterized protein n=1 Tax=Schizophyllum amplum TaxID=97359 RepID=A0A550CQ39_9AGAR|nr:hypothetical protein BD626DRAFT_484109 [Auriculariopsis ampla]
MPSLDSDFERSKTTVPGAFSQPSTIHVTPHIIDGGACWPKEVRATADVFTKDDRIPEYVRNLRRFFASFNLPQGETVHLELPNPGCPLLRSLIPICFATSSLMSDINLHSSALKTQVIVPFIASIFRALMWPDSRVVTNDLFARPIDPCCFDDPNAAFQSPYMVADALLLLTIPWEVEEKTSRKPSSQSPADSVEEDLTPSLDESLHSSSLMSTEAPSDDGQPPAYTQILSARSPGHVEIPFFCVASPSTIYTLVASAILQRRAVGIKDPAIGIAHDPFTSVVRIVFGWCEPLEDTCVNVHVAHCANAYVAPSGTCKAIMPNERRAHAMFDLRDPVEALEFALAVTSLCEDAACLVERAKSELELAQFLPVDDPIHRWRLADAGRDAEAHAASPEYLEWRMEAWLRTVCTSSA